MLGVVAVLAAACTMRSATALSADVRPAPSVGATPSTTPVIGAVSGLPAFYTLSSLAPSLLGARPGQLVRTEVVPSDGIDGTVERVAYVSSDLHGNPTVVTGLVMVPTVPAPASGYPVLAWDHGTDGMAPGCAPSLAPALAVPDVNAYLAHGWVVVAPDYQGEGSAGLLPYLVGEVAARNTLDIVRAALHLPGLHVASQVVVAGHSEGGQTALYVLDSAAAYAPELDLRGVVAEAPVADLDDLTSELLSTSFRYYVLMAIEGYHAAYGDDADPASVLTPLGQRVAATVDEGCAPQFAERTEGYTTSELFRTDPSSIPAWRTLLMSNDPLSFAQPAVSPLLVVQGEDDEQIPVVTSAEVALHECSLSEDTSRWIYPGVDHGGIVEAASGDTLQWIADRFAGVPTTDVVRPSGVPGVQVASCHL